MRQLLFVLLAIPFTLSTWAQNSSKSTPILLENFKISLEEKHWDYGQNEEVNGRIYRIVNDAPSLKLNRQFHGIHVLEFLPKRAFIVSINTDEIEQAQAFLRSENASAVLKIRPEWKLSHNMFKQNIPDWAWVDNSHFKATITYYKDLNDQYVIDQLRALGLGIMFSSPADQLVEITLKPEDIYAVANLPFIAYLEEMDKPGEPENNTARTNHRISSVQANFPGVTHFDGTGVTVGHGDDGVLGEHVDFTGRVSGLLGSNGGDHGDHVAGTIFGAGNKDPRGRGMAPGAEILYADYPDNLQNVDNDFDNHGVRITSSSYSNGCGAGYTNNSITGSRTMDMDVMQNPPVMHVFSAGNSGSSSCGYGTSGTSGGVQGWGNITGGHKVAKNVVTVANVTRVDALASSSSRGPAADGRIKPDIAAVGTSVYSTTDLPADHSYTQKTGTSMACPGVSGVMATLYEAFRTYNGGQDPESILMKGIACNTADDLGNPGPDFKHGYGRINARRAHEIVASGNWLTDSISTGTNTHTISVPSGSLDEVRVMLIWADPPTFPSAGPDLINDLDLDVAQGGTSYNPWVLNPFPSAFTLDQNAVRGRDSLNNMEQVTFTNPGSGNLTVDVSAFNIPSGFQKYYIVYEFVKDEIVITSPLGGEGFSPTRNEYIRWDAPKGTSTFRVEYSVDGGSNWTLINSSVNSSQRYFFWNVPNVTTDQAKVRVIRGNDTSTTPGTFVIANEPTNFSILSSCPDSLTLSWDPVGGVTGYNVYALGSKYMDSIGYTVDTFFVVSPSNPTSSDEWYSVSSVINGKAGERVVAIQKASGTFNCQLTNDLISAELLSPVPGVIPNCFPTNNIPVEIRLVNNGLNDIFNFTASYQFNGGPVVNSTVTDTIAVGQTMIYQFPGSSVNMTVGNTYDMDVWVDFTSDQNRYNDSIFSSISVVNGNLQNMPYTNNFEAFSICNTSADCGATTCNLNGGWRNLSNTTEDDIDFRTDAGGTPSNFTGPSVDFNPGTSNGKYVYLEASSGCDSSEAILISPCLWVDSISGQPMVEYAYHMSGADMGKLDVDLITESGIVVKVVPTVSGDQGSQWNVGQIDLTPWKGQVVMVRFRGKTGFGYRSDIALDNFRFFENGVAPPVSSFSITNNGTCVGDTFVFQSTSTGTVTNYLWNFGPGASPSTATTAGPHSVVYASGGNKQTSLEVSNSGGINTSTVPVTVSNTPIASYNYNQNNNVVNFNDISTNNPTSWIWDFGDGAGSTQQNPMHTYTFLGSFAVTLTAKNDCGDRNYVDTVEVTHIDLPEILLSRIAIYPNPTKGIAHISLPADLNLIDLQLSDLNGKLIRNFEMPSSGDEILLDLKDLPQGVYIIEVHASEGSRSFRLIKEN